MLVSALPRNNAPAPSPAPAPAPADPGQVYTTSDGFVQNFGQIESASGTLRLYDSGAAVLLSKDVTLKGDIKVHDDTVTNTVTFQRPDGAKIQFDDSEIGLPYDEHSDHAQLELRNHQTSQSPSGFVENVYASGDWNLTEYHFADGQRQDTPVDWKSLTPQGRWDALQKAADASNAQQH